MSFTEAFASEEASVVSDRTRFLGHGMSGTGLWGSGQFAGLKGSLHSLTVSPYLSGYAEGQFCISSDCVVLQ